MQSRPLQMDETRQGSSGSGGLQYGSDSRFGTGASGSAAGSSNRTRPPGGGASGAARLTPLGRELILSKEMRLINATYYKVPGIHEWDEYKRQLPSIQAHADAVAAALRRYRARRAERGMFKLVPREDHPVGFRVVSPLYALPRHARARALRKLRAQQREKRRAAARQRQTQVERPMA